MSWDPSLHATYVEAVFDPEDARPGSVLVEHFNDPYDAVLADGSDAALFAAAHAYLKAVAAHAKYGPPLRIPPYWLAALGPQAPADSYFGWLPFEAAHGGQDTFIGPYGSFRFQSPSDTLAVLFASDRVDADHYLGTGFGLAVAAHVRRHGGTLTATFTGLSATLPYGNYRAHALTSEGLHASSISLLPSSLYQDTQAIGTMAAAADLDDFAVRGVRIAVSDTQWWIERQGIGVRREGGMDIPYTVSMLSVRGQGPQTDTILHVARLVADADGDGPVFEGDPSSCKGRLVRPTRDLDFDRVFQNIFSGAETGPLKYPDAGKPVVEVMPCPRFVDADRGLDASKPRPVTLAPSRLPGARSDDASAVQAFFHTRDLVQRLQAYGWTAASYFRLTRPEIRVFYRSGISPGPGKDGRTVNARVIPEGWPADAIGLARSRKKRPAIEIHLALADLRRRDRKKWTSGGRPRPAMPFGVAADRRWMWHEFGHALLVASTGELEFRFAHSAGDALAAIVADPESRLPAKLRGSTFPFVFLPRRHDRCAHDGWSWSGTVHAALGNVPAAMHPRRKGYGSEQILSSSLFRMYRCIGGDTCAQAGAADVRERQRASHYALYLVMQAMQLMGDARILATATPARFVYLLRQADRQTGQWSATFDGAAFQRVGGTLAKVVRWVFEAQGLYGRGDGPGEPEPVDIYIDDLRRTAVDALLDTVDYGPGSYVPVSLHWQAAGMDAPAWQADPATGIRFPNPAGQAEVRVGNRGNVDALGVTVALWFARWDSGTPPPVWSADGAGWTVCQRSSNATQDIPRGPPSADLAFTFTFAPAAGRYVLLAQATCSDDRANTDPALSLACSYLPTPLPDLVACDNNLGLLVVDVA